LSHCVTLKGLAIAQGFEVNASIQYWNHANYRNVAGILSSSSSIPACVL
jgi:hypothetical protein